MLLEAWNKIVEYIPQKDRLEAAKAYVTLLDDYGIEGQDLEEFKGSDDYLETAISEHYEEVEEYDDGSEGSAYNDEDH
tara:strand:- start:31 stop:264 length:234 start_codon:yes stop_codon:yes gene_type:complete